MRIKMSGSLGVPKVEQSTRSQLYLDTSCASDGVLLMKQCSVPTESNKVYEPLAIGRGLAPVSDALGRISLSGIGGLIDGDGTLWFDDGANFRVTLVFWDGVLRSVTIGASVAGGANWTPFP